MFSFLKKTKENIAKLLGSTKQTKIDKDRLEDILIECDVSYDIIEKMFENLSSSISRDELRVAIDRFFRTESYYDRVAFKEIEANPIVYLMFGVNGAGKTTTIGKLAKRFRDNGKRVILGAGDTFRAAAIEQLSMWSKRIGSEIVLSQYAHDPSSVAFDTISAAKSRGIEYAIIDTAGRMPNATNLTKELDKICRTCAKALGSEDFHKILVLDGTQGSAAINQARIFSENIGLDGVVVSKMDGTSKGGAIMSIIHELRIPIAYLGVGEREGDLIDFNQDDYVNGMVDSIFE